MTGPVRVCGDAGALAREAAEWMAQALSAAARRRGRCTVALAGGSTPAPVYSALARHEDVPWSRVALYFGDERCVPPDSEESNYRMVRESLLVHLPQPRPAVHPMDGADPEPERAAARYARDLPHPFDVIVLGIGDDGHTASLFPGSPATAETERTVVAVEGPSPPRRRLTVTPPVLLDAREVVVLASGGSKARAVARALEGDEGVEQVPARLVRDRRWFLDGEAASELREPPA